MTQRPIHGQVLAASHRAGQPVVNQANGAVPSFGGMPFEGDRPTRGKYGCTVQRDDGSFCNGFGSPLCGGHVKAAAKAAREAE